ncbi:Hypothetical protein CINCED_3A024750 [Cinara cedri]|uniref:Uncharacterized protein n=1 Tax=Cinara cedri TaxID=506608 RepID=A0A5E4NDP8_9HEMI|nr:Hypothetical protein CINCED_3A024750 [Cinara cedri]
MGEIINDEVRNILQKNSGLTQMKAVKKTTPEVEEWDISALSYQRYIFSALLLICAVTPADDGDENRSRPAAAAAAIVVLAVRYRRTPAAVRRRRVRVPSRRESVRAADTVRPLGIPRYHNSRPRSNIIKKRIDKEKGNSARVSRTWFGRV